MIGRGHALSVTKQAEVVGIARSTVYYLPRPVSAADLGLMRQIDELHMEFPFRGGADAAPSSGCQWSKIGRRHVKALMKRMGIEALYRRPRTTKPEPGHKIYPYLLRGLAVTRPNQVWAMDITYIPCAGGQAEEVKVFLSRQRDAARAAYGRETTERPRQFVSVGTTNDDRYLIDGTGNRRFFPVRVSGEIDLEALRRDRDQLWGEAARRERGAGPDSMRDLFLPEHLWAVAARQQEERRVVGLIELALEDALGGIDAGFIASGDLTKIVSLRAGQGEARHVKLIAEAMRRLGWETDRRGNKRIWRKGAEWQAKGWVYDEETRAVVTAERARRSGFDDGTSDAPF